MKYLTKEQQNYFRAIREFWDDIIASIPTANETEFNDNAEMINTAAIATRVWLAGKHYNRGDIRIDPTDGVPYWAMHDHDSVEGAELQPSLTPTIWTHCHGTTPETARPFLAEGHNPYQVDHYCIENGTIYHCNTANMVHAPSVYPQAWDIVE